MSQITVISGPERRRVWIASLLASGTIDIVNGLQPIYRLWPLMIHARLFDEGNGELLGKFGF